jgi:uncharacterized protein (DUF433 family)
MLTIKEVISTNPEILGGTPVFAGTRVAINTLFDYLEISSLSDFLEGFPTVSREQAETVIEFAATLIQTVSFQYESAS